MLIKIYNSLGEEKAQLSPNDSSTQVKEIQGDSVLMLSFTHYDHIELDVDDYVDFLGERYWLTEKYRPKQNSEREWVYDIKLYGVESLIKNLLVVKTVDDEDEPVFTLTAPPRDHVAMIVKCMNDGMGNITDWKVGSVTGTENVVIDYFGKYCDEALKELAEKVGVEWWIEGQTVNLCRCEHGDPLTLGYNKGLKSIDPGTADNVKFYTRLYPVGSSRNIDREKYGFSRLQLPGGRRYVEINADKYGRKDHYEQDAFADIYPRRVGVVSSVRSEEKTGEDGNPFTIYYFKDVSIPFDPNDYEIGGLVKRVSFQEGSELGGLGEEDNGTYYFEVNFDSKTQEFEIITIWPYDDDTQLPGDKLIPKTGDKYILWNIRMPDEYYTLAEEEFLTAVNQYNAEHALDNSVFKAPTDHVWVEDNDAEFYIGRRVRLESEEYFPSMGFRDSRITKITRKVNLPSSMDIEIGDALSQTAMQKMSDSIRDAKSYAQTLAESITLPDIIRVGDNTKFTDNNLLSALRVLKEFLCKTKDDRTPYRLTSDTAFDIGDFLAGVSGARLGIDKADGKTFLEVDNITARVKAYFEQLNIINANTVAGRQYITPGGSVICTMVKETDTTFRCYFLSEQAGEKTETYIKADDQAIAEMFNAKEGTANSVTNHRWWRLVMDVQQSAYIDDSGNVYGYIEVSKSDCETGSSAPQIGDVICQFGSRNDTTRQSAMIFDTVGNDSPSTILLTGIGSGTTNAEYYSLANKAIISFGYDHAKGEVFFRLGESGSNQYLNYTQGSGLDIAGNISVKSTLGDKPIETYISDKVTDETDVYKYLQESLEDAKRDSADVMGGLILATSIRLGKTVNGVRDILAGMNGSYNDNLGGRTIASWWGGDMIDRFGSDGKLLSDVPLNAAAALTRMDGSAYWCKGNVGFEADGSGWLGNYENGIRFGTDGSMTFGNGIKINLDGSQKGLMETLQSLLNFGVGIRTLFVPCDENNNEISWEVATQSDGAGGYRAKSLKAKLPFFSVGEVTALGAGGDDGGQGSGTGGSLFGLMRSWPGVAPDEGTTDALGANLGWELHEAVKSLQSDVAKGLDTAGLAQYLSDNQYARLSDIPSLPTKLPNPYGLAFTRNGLNVDTYDGSKAVAVDLTVKWADVQDTPSAFTPSTHTHAISEVTGLQSALDGKSSTSHNHDGVYSKIGHTHAEYLTEHQSLAAYYTKTDADGRFVKKSGDTMTGNLTVPRINVTGSASSNAYITADSATNLYFNAGGNSLLVIDGASKAVRPSNSLVGQVSLGSSSNRWSNVYSVLGNFSGELTAGSVKIGSSPAIEWDASTGAFKFNAPIYSTGEITALGVGSGTGSGSGGGVSYDRLDAWSDYTSDKSGYVLSAALGYDLYTKKLSTTEAASLYQPKGSYLTASDISDMATQTWTRNNYVKAIYANESTINDLNELWSYRSSIGSVDVTSNAPNGNGWYNVIQLAHRNGVSDGPSYVGQIALGMTVNHEQMYFRTHRTRTWQTVLTNSNYSSVLGSVYQAKGNYVTTDTAQTITVEKTFTNNINALGTLFFKNSSREDGIYIVARSDSDKLQFSHHKNYVWQKNIGTLDISGNLTMNSFVKSGGTSSQFLKADGSVDSTAYATTSALSGYLPKSGGTMTGTLNMANGTAVIGVSDGCAIDNAYGYINVMRTKADTNQAFFSMVNSGTAARCIGLSAGSSIVMGSAVASGKTLSPWLTVAQNSTTAPSYISTVATGTAPISVTSTTVCTNLNADMVDGVHINGLVRRNQTWSSALDVADWAKSTQDGPAIYSTEGWSWAGSKFLTVGNYSLDNMRYSALMFRTGNLNTAWQQKAILFLPTYSDSKMMYIAQMSTSGTAGEVATSVKRYADYDTILNSNVASATKLADNTACTAWGQTFFENGVPKTVSGDLTGVGKIAASGNITVLGNHDDTVGVTTGIEMCPHNANDYRRVKLLAVAETAWSNRCGLAIYTGRNDIETGERVRINWQGYVGINTASPTQLLDVNGTAKVSKLIIGDCEVTWDSTNSCLKFSKAIVSADEVTALKG